MWFIYLVRSTIIVRNEADFCIHSANKIWIHADMYYEHGGTICAGCAQALRSTASTEISYQANERDANRQMLVVEAQNSKIRKLETDLVDAHDTASAATGKHRAVALLQQPVS